MTDEIATFADYEAATQETAIYPGQGGVLGLVYCALKLNGESGELAEHVGKGIRDDALMADNGDVNEFITAGQLSPERRELIIKEIGDCLWYLARLCRELGTSLASVAAANVAKLLKRKAEGKLGGSGDNR